MAVGMATGVLLIAVAANGIATGATLDQAIKQLPARHRIGPVAYISYVRAADLTNGLYWYPPLGLGTAVLTLAAVAAGLTAHPKLLEPGEVLADPTDPADPVPTADRRGQIT